MEETGVPRGNQRLAASHGQTSSHNVVSSTPPLSGIQTRVHPIGAGFELTLVVLATVFIGSYTSNYHMISQ